MASTALSLSVKIIFSNILNSLFKPVTYILTYLPFSCIQKILTVFYLASRKMTLYSSFFYMLRILPKHFPLFYNSKWICLPIFHLLSSLFYSPFSFCSTPPIPPSPSFFIDNRMPPYLINYFPYLLTPRFNSLSSFFLVPASIIVNLLPLCFLCCWFLLLCTYMLVSSCKI